MRLSIRFAAALALLVLALAAVGCGETVIDDNKAEETLQKNLESRSCQDQVRRLPLR